MTYLNRIQVLGWIQALKVKFDAEGKEVNKDTITEFAWETLNAGKVNYCAYPLLPFYDSLHFSLDRFSSLQIPSLSSFRPRHIPSYRFINVFCPPFLHRSHLI
jgi:hypothetical protein